MKRIGKLSGIALLAVVMIFSLTSMAFASADCSSAQVTMVGAAPGLGGAGSSGVKVMLKNMTGHTVGTDWANGTVRMFFLTTDLGDQGLATLLTAMSLNKNVWVRIAGNAEPASLISIVYLSN